LDDSTIFLRSVYERKEIAVIQHQNCNQFTKMKRVGGHAVAILCLLIPFLAKAADDSTEQARVTASGDVLKELLNGPSGVPLSILNKAECVVLLPSVKREVSSLPHGTAVE
jgi:SH3 domain-containing YSC84-like protein 1